MSLKITAQEKKPGYHEIALTGRLDTDTSPELEKVLTPILAEGARAIQLNMASLGYISSMGLRVVLKTAKQLRAAGGNIMLTNLQPHIRKVFEIAAALPTEAVFSSIEEADAYFDEMQRRELEKGNAGG